jgi:uracil-DNA glycosylase
MGLRRKKTRALTSEPRAAEQRHRNYTPRREWTSILQALHGSGAVIVATYHPSAILRAEGDRAEALRASLVADLVQARLKSEEAN